MSAQKIICPGCRNSLNIPRLGALKGSCPRCNVRFAVSAQGVISKLPPRMENETEPDQLSASLPWGKIGLLGGIGVSVLALVVVILILSSGGSTPIAEGEKDRTDGDLVLSPPSGTPVDSYPGHAKGMDTPITFSLATAKTGESTLNLAAKTVKMTPVAVSAGHPGVDQAAVNAAIDKGTEYLKRSGDVPLGGGGGLAGLTLLYCGVDRKDPVVQKIADRVRKEAHKSPRTYELATAVWFLDRLGEPGDRELIRDIALRLIAGQMPRGGWNYTVPVLTSDQQSRLYALLQEQTLVINPKTRTTAEKKPIKRTGPGVPLKGDLRELPVFSFVPGKPITAPISGHEDNSLTQFAILALWRAKDHGIPVDRSLAFAEARFRQSQADTGTWSYTWTATKSAVRTDSMTCSGLMGLAVGRGSYVEMVKRTRGVAPESKDEGPDPAIENGLKYLAKRLKEIGKLPVTPGTGDVGLRANSLGDLYFLWSLERMAMVYDLRTIGDTDWYAWGVPYILKAQQTSGAWRSVPDTCFALLFLRRANVAQDLTVALQGLAVTKDAGERGAQLSVEQSQQQQISQGGLK